MLQDLDPGTKYGMLWFVACSTVNANSCQQLDAQEFSLPIKIPPLTTEMPVVSGNVNDGTCPNIVEHYERLDSPFALEHRHVDGWKLEARSTSRNTFES